VITRYVAQLFEAAGIVGVITLEVRNVAAFQNTLRIPTLHVESAEVFAPRGSLCGCGAANARGSGRWRVTRLPKREGADGG